MTKSIAQFVEVRKDTGDIPYGPWIPLDHEDVPPQVVAKVKQKLKDSPSGRRINHAGSLWNYRTTNRPGHRISPRSTSDLSPMAKSIVDEYRVNVSGRHEYLTNHMKRIELRSVAFHNLMMSSWHRPETPIKDYANAFRDAERFLKL